MRNFQWLAATRPGGRSLPQDIGISVRATTWHQQHPDSQFNWLDIGCGPGALVRQIDRLFPEELRAQIVYYGYDIRQEFIEETRRAAEGIGLTHHCRVGELSALHHHFGDRLYHGITAINILHELSIEEAAGVFLDVIALADAIGFAYLFDIGTIPYDLPEPGAMIWTVKEVNQLLAFFCRELGAAAPIRAREYKSRHGGWHCVINRQAFGASQRQIEERRDQLVSEAEETLRRLFRRRKRAIDLSLRTKRDEFREAQLEEFLVTRPADASLISREKVQAMDRSLRDYWSIDFRLSELSASLRARRQAS